MNATLARLAFVLVSLGGVAVAKVIYSIEPPPPEPTAAQKLAIAVEKSLQAAKAPANAEDEHRRWASVRETGAPMEIVEFLRAYPQSSHRQTALALLNDLVERNEVTRGISTDLVDVNR